MVDVLLWEWEWACCGEPFAVGDRVEFGVVDAEKGVRELCAPAADPVFVETHHEREPELRISGVVRSVAALTVAHRMMRLPRRQPAPGITRFSSPGAEWAIEVRPTPYVLTSEQLIGTAQSEPLEGVSRAVEDDDAEPAPREADPADGDIRRHLVGYLVTIDED
ncbi:DUF6578 domain-containing protein [Microbacterium sp. SORGH_AS_0862]|uniref:DUF6578 domain-containing protein n=1 Tax=Microbacterium sp. SORGH_AS_0862 TaxID=3041789 RepID=UPI0027919DA1|nr:DUF6578 domain-containing protein [Microbacterium sp. SORGH_AS_0862]MDQ1204021.1 hypothetical protein [Microbacterium sp. SORGH_AS_0862]